MAYEQRPGDIAIFANDKREKDTHPAWKGSLIVPDDAKPGDKLDVALWEKGGKGTMLAGQVQVPRQAAQGSQREARSGALGGQSYGIDDADVPF